MRLIPTEVRDVYLVVAVDPDTDKPTLLGAFTLYGAGQVNGAYDKDGWGIKNYRKDRSDYNEDDHASKA